MPPQTPSTVPVQKLSTMPLQTLSTMPFQSRSAMPRQTLSDVYIDPDLLKALLGKLFGRGNYRIQVSNLKRICISILVTLSSSKQMNGRYSRRDL
jgi:hypothetical protein